jgi:hypothetical protein
MPGRRATSSLSPQAGQPYHRTIMNTGTRRRRDRAGPSERPASSPASPSPGPRKARIRHRARPRFLKRTQMIYERRGTDSAGRLHGRPGGGKSPVVTTPKRASGRPSTKRRRLGLRAHLLVMPPTGTSGASLRAGRRGDEARRHRACPTKLFPPDPHASRKARLRGRRAGGDPSRYNRRDVVPGAR